MQNEHALLLQQSKELTYRGKKSSERQQSQEITDSLHHILHLLREDEDKLQEGGATLEEDQDTMNHTNATLKSYANSMTHSAAIVSVMSKREQYEKRILYASIIFFVLVVGFIVLSRTAGTVQKVMYIPLSFVRFFRRLLPAFFVCYIFLLITFEMGAVQSEEVRLIRSCCCS